MAYSRADVAHEGNTEILAAGESDVRRTLQDWAVYHGSAIVESRGGRLLNI